MADTAQPPRGLFFGFRQFVYRDAMYIVSGLVIFTAILYSFGKLSWVQPNMLFTPTIVLLAFVVGYVTQEFAEILGLVRTRYRKPSWATVTLLRWVTGMTIWSALPNTDDVDWDALLICNAGGHHGQGSASLRVHVERIASLMHVGSSVAPGLLLSATILALKVSLPVKLMSSVVAGKPHQDQFDVVLIVVASMIGLGLLITNRLKNAQLYRLLFMLNEKCRLCKGGAVTKAATDSAKDTTPNGDGVSSE